MLPHSQVTSLGGFIDAIKTVFTVYGGHIGATPTQTTLTGVGKVIGDIAAVAFIFAPTSSGTTWIMGADRAASRRLLRRRRAALPRHGSRSVSARRSPSTSLSGDISSLFMILAF